MKKILVVFFMISYFLSFCHKEKEVSRNIDNYVNDCESIQNASVLMPDIADLGTYSELEYTYQETCYSEFMGFYSYGLALFVKYDQETYEVQKEKVLNSYAFLEAPVMRSSDTYELPVTEFEYKDYVMKIVPDDEYIDYCACKSFLMLGLNDDECVIAYLYYFDYDLDYIATIDEDLNAEMISLIEDAFSWVSFDSDM